MQNVNVTTEVTEVLPAANRNGARLIIQNQSDTTMKLAFGAANVALLTASLGFNLAPNAEKTLEGNEVSRPISAIHAGTGSKVLHWQLI